MNNIEVWLVNAFTESGKGGNPAGVVLNADGLSHEDKLHIAKEVGFSETAFVSQDREVDFCLSFFTTTEEVDFCGHATLAAFSILYTQGQIAPGNYVQRTKAGILAIAIDDSGSVVMEQRLPRYLGTLSYASVAELIGLETELLASTQLPIEIVSTGLADIIVPVPTGHLDELKVNDQLLSEYSKQHQVIGIHAFELEQESSDITAHCRNFAPLYGISEESATGSASGALACYLAKYCANQAPHHYVFQQGRAMGCTSRISVSLETNHVNHDISKVRVGGVAVAVGKRIIGI